MSQFLKPFKRQSLRRFSFVNPQDYNPGFKAAIENQHKVKSNLDYRFAIIGCGPAGFYCAKNLLKNVQNVRVDIFDRNPHPYGLVRTGVAPDHPDMKKIENDYEEILQDPRCEFFGNVWVGDKGGLKLDILRELYSGIVLAHGAIGDRKLGLPGEDTLKNVYSSREVVNWYNGSLDCEPGFSMGLDKVRDVVIVGNGNVAVDISRVLLKDIDSEFKGTDMPVSVMDELRQSAVKNVQMVGRRGLIQAAFTTKELRELTRIKDLQLVMVKEEVEQSMTEESKKEMAPGFSTQARGITRRTNLMNEACTIAENEEQLQEILGNGKRTLVFRFLKDPVEFISNDQGAISGTKFQKTALSGVAGQIKADRLDEFSTLDCQMLVTSIGYKTHPIEGAPFNPKTNTIPHLHGCVVGEDGQMIKGLYVAGWAKRGPVGIIDSTLRESMDTFRVIKHHLEEGVLPGRDTKVERVVEEVGKVSGERIVSYGDWLKIDRVERERGQQKGKVREKFLNKTDMMSQL